MSRILVFAFGAVFGAASVFYFFVLNRPQPEPLTVAVCPPEPAAVAPAQACVPPLAAEASTPFDSIPPTQAPTPIEPATEPMITTTTAPPLRPQPGPLLLPVAGVQAGQLSDTFTDSRGDGGVHDAIDIMAPKGTPVVAVDDGKVAKLFNSVPGGLTVYQFDAGEKFAYYYAHLDGYAPGIAEGRSLKRGDLIGYVGSSGNASVAAPHLHFAIFVLGPEKRWWEGTAINPYPFFTGP